MKETILEHLTKAIELAKESDNLPLQGILYGVMGAVQAEQEMDLFMGMSPAIEQMTNALKDHMAQRN